MQSTKAQTTVRILLGLFLLLAGISHLSFQRTAFLAQVPEWLPIPPDTVVVLSGVVEILLGASLIFVRKQSATVGCIVVFFIAVFPGNIAQLINHKDAFGLNSDLLRWIRLPFQPLLMVLVLWSTGALSSWRNKLKWKNQFHELLPEKGNY